MSAVREAGEALLAHSRRLMDEIQSDDPRELTALAAERERRIAALGDALTTSGGTLPAALQSSLREQDAALRAAAIRVRDAIARDLTATHHGKTAGKIYRAGCAPDAVFVDRTG